MDTIDRFLDSLTSGRFGGDLFAADAVLDATVPQWRFTVTGGREVAAQFGSWFHDPARFEELRRQPLPEGELVEFLLAWEEHGVPHAAHQAHVVTLDEDGLIAQDTMYCGGRWPAALLAEMEAARCP